MTWRKRAAAFVTGLAMLISTARATDFEACLENGSAPSLKEHYAGCLEIGIPAEKILHADTVTLRLAAEQCSMLICVKQTRGNVLLDRAGSKKKKDPEHARLRIGDAAAALDVAAEKGMNVRAGTVIRSDDTPEWFFNEEWAASSSAKRMNREIMILRTENAIQDQITMMNEKYPGLITEWEVVRSSVRQAADPYRETIGDDYVQLAFEAARACAADGQKLFWAMEELPGEAELAMLKKLQEENLADGIVLECSLGMGETEIQDLENGLQKIADIGLEIRLSGVEIACSDRSAAGRIRLAIRYRQLFGLAERLAERGNTTGGISLAALQDEEDWKEKNSPPRLFDVKGRCTPALFGALQDESIPITDSEEAVNKAVKQLNLNEIIKKEADPVINYKKAENHNPVMVQRFGADPWAMVYGDRVYLYMTGDEPVAEKGAKPRTNDYSNITTLRVISSADLVNWEDHGSVRAAGAGGAARWATNSWAPCAAWKTIDGKDRFFLYFANSGGGIGVLTADSPTGPFTDPLGKPLISRSTPTCASVTWLFDPAVLVDEDGSAYLYFGGGIPEGKAEDPGTARVVKLQDDMIHLDGDPVAFNPPWLFEDSGINRFGDVYVYSYCSNFNVPASGSKQGFGSGEIVYMTSDNPMGPFSYGGQVLRNPGSFFGVGGNNHHCMFSFRDQWYITYHAATLDRDYGWNAGYRSTFVDKLVLNPEGLPAPSKGTYTGVEQLQALDPYQPVPAATAVNMAGVTTELADSGDRKAGTGPMAVVSETLDGWVAVAGADFGPEGAAKVRMRVRSEAAAKIEVVPDSERGEPAVTVEIPAGSEETEITAMLSVPLTGMHDLYFRFTESGVTLLEWQFQK